MRIIWSKHCGSNSIQDPPNSNAVSTYPLLGSAFVTDHGDVYNLWSSRAGHWWQCKEVQCHCCFIRRTDLFQTNPLSMHHIRSPMSATLLWSTRGMCFDERRAISNKKSCPTLSLTLAISRQRSKPSRETLCLRRKVGLACGYIHCNQYKRVGSIRCDFRQLTDPRTQGAPSWQGVYMLWQREMQQQHNSRNSLKGNPKRAETNPKLIIHELGRKILHRSHGSGELRTWMAELVGLTPKATSMTLTKKAQWFLKRSLLLETLLTTLTCHTYTCRIVMLKAETVCNVSWET